MSKEYLFFYIESMIVCIVIFGVLLGYDLFKGTRQERQFRFDNVLLAHILYFISDAFWAAVSAGALPKTVFTVLLTNYLNLFLLCLIANTWFFYATVLADMPRRNTKRGKLMIWLPMLVSSTFVLLMMFIKPELWITAEKETTVLYSIFFIGPPVFYLISALLYALHQARKETNRINRKFYNFVAFYPMTVVVAGVIQTFFINIPIFCYSCTVMMLIFYIMSMDDQISLDPLTKLNNRGQLIHYVEQGPPMHREGLHTYVVMADVNDFKKINDTWGHEEGDRALILIAEVLRNAAGSIERSPFLARYGGDEFILIVYSVSPDEPASMIGKIRRALEESCQEEKRPYIIRMGFGVDEYMMEDTFEACMKRADDKLYLDKRQMKEGVEKTEGWGTAIR